MSELTKCNKCGVVRSDMSAHHPPGTTCWNFGFGTANRLCGGTLEPYTPDPVEDTDDAWADDLDDPRLL